MSFRLRSIVVVAIFVVGLLAPVAAIGDDFMSSSPGPLTSSHESLEGQEKCGDCHTKGKELSNDKCLGCHDHENQKAKIASGRGFHSSSKVAGRDCWTCHLEHKGKTHDVMGWAAVGGMKSYDHELSAFALKGAHKVVKCEDCHKRKNNHGVRVFLGEKDLCGTCHKEDQPHRFEREEMMKCDRCHGEVAWKPSKKLDQLEFDHNDKKQAEFPLEGTHTQVACAKCHPKSEFNLVKDTRSCSACHENVHVGQLFEKVACDKCHSPNLKSLADFRFNHAKETKFDLTGAHAKTKCDDCHPKGQKVAPKMECETCHAKDSKHAARFDAFGGHPPKCGTCHPTSSWDPSLFDHDKQTRFKLTGEHAKAGCRDCHRGKDPSDYERFNPKTVGCMGCHQHAKVHPDKATGRPQYRDNQCTQCHKMGGVLEAPESTKDRFHGPRSRFPLRFAHAEVACKTCHKNDNWKGLSIECGKTCHQDSLHRGSLGDKCSRCHVGGIWDAKTFSHDEDSDFKLIGNHKTAATCEKCHPKREYKPTPRSCGAAPCHLEDDAHKGKLGTHCESCHVETGANIFEHNKQADFKLDNAHLKVACKTCHPSVSFKPQPKDCFGCHPEPAVHKGQYGTTCEGCHDTVAWNRIKPIHDVGNFSLTGAHDNVDCRRCHKDSRPLAGTGNLCVTCHREDDIHGNSLGPRCGECHTQWGFSPARFDHTTVGCDLQGQHRTLPCLDCHKQGNYRGLSPDCYSCHHDTAVAEGPSPGGAGIPDYKTTAGCGGCHSMNFWTPANVGVAGGNSVCR